MKTRLVFLVMLLVCFSCGTNNKPLSDDQKDGIKKEIKEVVNTFIKGIEEANADMVMESFLDSPDFTDITNGMVFSYKDLISMKSNFDAIQSQKCTITSEKYTFLDKSTVLYTAETNWSTNYRDGQSSITDPQAFLIIFKKIDNKWKIIYLVDSNVEKNVPSESSKGLNQAELLEKFVGNWEGPAGEETTQFTQFKNLDGNNVLSLYTKGIEHGKTVFEGTGFWGYDAVNNRIDLSVILSMGHVFHYTGEFTSPDKLELFDVNRTSGNKFTFEFISRDEFKETTIENNETSSRIVKRVK